MRTSFLEYRVPPPLLMLAVAAAMWVAAQVAPEQSWPPTVRLGASALLAALGVGFNVAGFQAIRRAGSTIDPTRPSAASALVIDGAFRISRNPMYVGFTAMLLAWGAWLQSAWVLGAPILFALYLTRYQIVPEERALRKKFAAAYPQYEARVRRWL